MQRINGDGTAVKDEQLLRRVAGYSFAVMIITICLSAALQQKEPAGQERDATKQQEELYTEYVPTVIPEVTQHPLEVVSYGGHSAEEEVWEVWQMLSQDSMEALREELGKRCVLIRKPEGEDFRWKVEENLPYYNIKFTVTGAEESLHAASVLRFLDDNYYYGLPDENEILKALSVISYQEGTGITSEVSMTFDRCYCPEVMELEDYYIVNLQKYSEIYDKIVVLDAGHGGKDPGAGADNYRTEEADITLKLLLYLKELLEENTDITVFCTRTEDVYPTLQERADLALGMEADLFISWHCNSSTSSKRNGTEIIYNAEQGKEDAFNSRSFAILCKEKLLEALDTRDGGIMNRQDLHIVRRATMPVVLIETAYMSNAQDLALLKDDEMLHAAAEAVYEAVLEAYDRMEENE